MRNVIVLMLLTALPAVVWAEEIKKIDPQAAALRAAMNQKFAAKAASEKEADLSGLAKALNQNQFRFYMPEAGDNPKCLVEKVGILPDRVEFNVTQIQGDKVIIARVAIPTKGTEVTPGKCLSVDCKTPLQLVARDFPEIVASIPAEHGGVVAFLSLPTVDHHWARDYNPPIYSVEDYDTKERMWKDFMEDSNPASPYNRARQFSAGYKGYHVKHQYVSIQINQATNTIGSLKYSLYQEWLPVGVQNPDLDMFKPTKEIVCGTEI